MKTNFWFIKLKENLDVNGRIIFKQMLEKQSLKMITAVRNFLSSLIVIIYPYTEQGKVTNTTAHIPGVMQFSVTAYCLLKVIKNTRLFQKFLGEDSCRHPLGMLLHIRRFFLSISLH
jgi:hypothetical protein